MLIDTSLEASKKCVYTACSCMTSSFSLTLLFCYSAAVQCSAATHSTSDERLTGQLEADDCLEQSKPAGDYLGRLCSVSGSSLTHVKSTSATIQLLECGFCHYAGGTCFDAEWDLSARRLI